MLFALTPSGALKWAMVGFSGLPRAVSSAGALYAADGYHLTSINPSGTINWQISLQSFYSSPAIGNDGTIYTATNESGLLALNPADGSLKWQFATGGLSSPSIGADGTIYVPDTAALYAVNPDGTFKWLQDWSSTTQCGVYHNEPAIGPDGTIYIIPDNDGQPCTIVDPSPPLLAIH